MPGILNAFILGGGGGGGGPLSLTLSPGDPTNVYRPGSTDSATSEQYALVTGGTPPYTYLWTRLSADDGITTGDTAANPLSMAATGDGGTINTCYEEWECEVTDAALDTVSATFWMQFNFGVLEP